MKVTFNMGIGYPAANRKEEIDTEKDLGFTDEEWNDLEEEGQFDVLMDWASNYINVYIS